MPDNIITRKTKIPILIVGEGPNDKAFLQHLQDTYVSRESNIAVKVECGSGGSPRSVVEKTIRLRSNKDYDKCIVIVDQDMPLETDKQLRRRMKEHPPVKVMWIKPCMEGLLLEILKHPHFSRYSATVDFCKHAFATYIPIEKQAEKHPYARTFPKTLLDSSRKDSRLLDDILKTMQG